MLHHCGQANGKFMTVEISRATYTTHQRQYTSKRGRKKYMNHEL